jgi:hypothetical protein
LDKFFDLENRLANAEAGASHPIFFVCEKRHLSRLNSCRDKKDTHICPGWIVPVEKPGQKVVTNWDKIAIL